MINPDLDLAACREAFRVSGRIRIRDVLRKEIAERIVQTMLTEVSWDLAMLADGQNRLFSAQAWAVMPQAERIRLVQQAHAAGRAGFQYVFEYYAMRAALHEGRSPPTFLNEVTAFIESDDFLAFCKKITGDEDLARADCQATCYRNGHYLNQHDDIQIPSRRHAFVLNLTDGWRADWGGLLLFFDSQGRVTEGFVPSFNVMTLFRVPVVHAVTMVSPFSACERLAITGWIHEASPKPEPAAGLRS